MKSGADVMEILEAYDLTGSYRAAGGLAGCSHHTVQRYVAAREAGMVPAERAGRARSIDPFLVKVEEWVEKSRGKVRADRVHEKLVAMGYAGSERTTRRAVARVKVEFRRGNTRVHRPWVPEPGLWLQYDFGEGPKVGGVPTVLFCAWVAWSRFRVVIPLRDKTIPSVLAALDQTFRILGGVPTYVLTDNEKSVTIEHVAGLAVRHPMMVEFGRYYSVSVKTCLPADPASKGGTEATVRVAKADLVPTETNLLAEYETFAELIEACEAFCTKVNQRVHRVTRRVPAQMLAEEAARFHPVPDTAHTLTLGTTRKVAGNTPMITVDGAQYSVPHTLLGQVVWVRYRETRTGRELVVVHVGDAGPVEVARHAVTTPGNPRVDDAHFPPAPPGALDRAPKARSHAEREFLSLGDGAVTWLSEATAAGTTKIRVKMAAAVDLAALLGAEEVDWALGHAAVHHRFAEADLGSILAHHRHLRPGGDQPARAGEARSLTQGTRGWASYTGTSCCTHIPKVAQ